MRLLLKSPWKLRSKAVRAATGTALCCLLLLFSSLFARTCCRPPVPAKKSPTARALLDRAAAPSASPVTGIRYNLGFLWYDAGEQQSYFRNHLGWTIRSILKHSTVALHFHVVTASTKDYAMVEDMIVQVADDLGVEVPEMSRVHVAEFIEDHREEIGHIKSLNAKPGTKFFQDMNALYPLLPDLLENISEILMVDTDLRFLEDVKYLFHEFDRFPPSALIGCAPELNPSFYLNLAPYRRRNPDTALGRTEPKHMQGLNTGVLLLKLDELRRSPTYRRRLERGGSSALFAKYEFDLTRPYQAGHQDFFTLLSFEHPELFHILDCGWNRNLCERKFFEIGRQSVPKFNAYFACMEKTKVLHGNCGAPLADEV